MYYLDNVSTEITVILHVHHNIRLAYEMLYIFRSQNCTCIYLTVQLESDSETVLTTAARRDNVISIMSIKYTHIDFLNQIGTSQSWSCSILVTRLGEHRFRHLEINPSRKGIEPATSSVA